MRNIILAFRSFFRKGNGNIIKVLSLGTGMAIGIVLIAKVCFEVSYDNFYSDCDRIYQISTEYSREGEEMAFSNISGAIAPGFKEYVSGVVESTRITNLFGGDTFITPDKKRYSAESSMADTNFFKIFDRPILAGDPVEVLSKRFYAMVSRSFAEKMGGIAQAMDKIILNDERLDLPFTIGGVFEDFPENGTFHYEVIMSLETYPKSSTENWVGNDRYHGWVKLAQEADPMSLTDDIHRMQEDFQPLADWAKDNFKLWYTLKPFETAHTDEPEIRNMNILLSLIAFALIFTAVMNYILIVISSLVRRTKEVGVRKCYGAERGNIRSIMMAETTLHLLCSLIIAAGLIIACRGMIEGLVGASLAVLFNPTTIFVLIGVILLVYLVSGLIPSYIFMKIPVSTVFRSYKESKRRWKLALLFFQFTATAFLVALLVIIGKQYNKMANDNPGYKYENLLYCDTEGVKYTQVLQVIDQLKALPSVDMVEACTYLPFGSSGNNIYFPGEYRELFNVADQYGGTEGFFDLMEFKIIEGRHPKFLTEVAVSRSFVEKMKNFADWSDGVIGKEICVTEHSNYTGEDTQEQAFTICGVYEDYRIGSIADQDNRPSIRFCYEIGENSYTSSLSTLVIKLYKLDGSSLPEITEIIKKAMPEKEIEVHVYREEIRKLYLSSKKMRDSVMIGGIVTLIIALIGLIGYTNDETNRRSSEIAVRKINGAVTSEVIALFVKDILRISLPAIILGNIATIFVAMKWMEQFSEKISLSPWIFIVCGIAVLAIILVVMILDCLKIANSNPVDSLKNE